MANIIQVSDFTGRYSIAKNVYTEANIQDYIDYYEKIYLTELLGAELYNLFISDLVSGVPQDPIYQAIFNPFSLDENNCLIISDGIKDMILGFCFFEIMRKSDAQQTISGNTRNVMDNSSNISQIQAGLYTSYNTSIKSYDAIQWFICDNEVNYPTYNGQEKNTTTWL